MTAKKINPYRLLALIDSGHTQSEIAKIFGVSRQAVNQELKRLRGKNTRVTVCKKIEQVVDRKIDVLGQLKQINDKALQVLDEAMESVGEGESWRKQRQIALQAMSEVRAQLSVQIEIFKSLYSLRAAEQFMDEVLEVLREVSPELRSRVLAGLRRRQAISSAVTFT